MARPREFDQNAVLDAAIDRFWRHGYEATSVRDLAASMGIACGSLYNTFDDKRTLFRAALDRYLDCTLRARIARAEAVRPARDALRAFLDGLIEHSVTDSAQRGCFLVNAAQEIAPHDPDLRAVIADSLREIEAFYGRMIEAGQADGSIPADHESADLARLLLGITLGIRVLARANPDRALLEGIARPVLAMLDVTPT